MSALGRLERDRGELSGIEGLRAVAAIMVVGYHASFVGSSTGGYAAPAITGSLRYGLVLFFVLSGFLLYRPMALAMIAGKGPVTLSSYLRNRAARILPAYWVILLVCGFVLRSVVTEWPREVGSLSAPGTIVSNALLVQNYSAATLYTGITPAWSLVVEVTFYIVLPLVTLAVWKLAQTPARIPPLAVACAPGLVFIALGLATRGILAFGVDGSSPVAFVLPATLPCQSDLFGLGMLAASVQVAAPRWLIGRSALVAAVAAGLIVMAVVVRPGAVDQGGFLNVVVGIAAALTILLVTSLIADASMRVLESRPLVAIGLASYSVYLWHVPIIGWLQLRGLRAHDPVGLGLDTLLVFVVTLLASTLTYVAVERPALRFRRHVSSVARHHSD